MNVLLIPHGAKLNWTAIAVADCVFHEVDPGEWEVMKARDGDITLVTNHSDGSLTRYTGHAGGRI